MAFTEALSKCRNLTSDTPEIWNAEPGTLIRFSIGFGGPILGEVVVPSAPPTENPHYECFATLDEAIVSSPLSL